MNEALQSISSQCAQELKQMARRLDAISEELPFEISVRRNLISQINQVTENCNALSTAFSAIQKDS